MKSGRLEKVHLSTVIGQQTPEGSIDICLVKV